MPKCNGGEALIQSLYREGVRTVFGIPGLGQYEAVDALYGMQHVMRYISVRNEQAASYMADGYARASGEIAAALVVPGPGVLNAAAGIATAFAVSSPMLVITGTDHQREGWDDERDPPLLHALSKWTARAGAVEEIPALVQRAMLELRQGRPRPVVLEVPQEVLADRSEVTFLDPTPVERAGLEPEQADLAAEWMARAQRPLICAGSGVHRADAGEALQQLAETWRAPVITSRGGKGAISDRHPLSLGMGMHNYAPLSEFIDQSDLVLAVGTSMEFSDHPGRVMHINIDPSRSRQRLRPAGGGGIGGAIKRTIQSGLGGGETRLELLGDARTILEDLLAQAESYRAREGASTEQVHAEVAALNDARFAEERQLQPQGEITRAIRNVLPDDAMLATDMTQLGYYSRLYYPVYAPRSYFTCSRLWTLGAAFPIALGAALAQPQRPALAIMGDGGFLYNSQELATAVQYDIPIVVLLFNDNAYGNVLRAQEEEFDGRILGTRLNNPDFIQLAQSYGIWNRRVHEPHALADALRQALELRKPALIEMPVGPMKRAV